MGRGQFPLQVRPAPADYGGWKARPRGLRFPPLAAPSALPFPAVLPSPEDGCHLPEGLGERQVSLGVVARVGRVDELLGE